MGRRLVCSSRPPVESHRRAARPVVRASARVSIASVTGIFLTSLDPKIDYRMIALNVLSQGSDQRLSRSLCAGPCEGARDQPELAKGLVLAVSLVGRRGGEN